MADGDSKSKETLTSDNKGDARKARLSQALRDNLHRRKAQIRARKSGDSVSVQDGGVTKDAE